eukprot:c11971_g1_i1 orf=139-3204(+)
MVVDGELAGGEQEANARLLAETATQLSESASRLERASRLLPTDEDFHFFSNFIEFREPVQGLQSRANGLLSQLSSLRLLPRAPALPSNRDDLADWLVCMQDELLEQVDSAFDLFKKERAGKGLPPPENDAFMYQNTKKKRRLSKETKPQREEGKADSMTGKKAERCPIPFHVWSIPRPQEKFDDPVDNSNTPFKHPKPLSDYLQKVESDTSAHPLQDKLQKMTFEDMLIDIADPKEPASLAETPFTFVNTPSLLKEVAAKLSVEREIAVDLEHHQFRSFQGLTCLMQISTRSEDFIIDTLELRSIIGPHLYDIFANPTIQKVMHGANWDVMWLQRDFGIYICNLFDTGQAARVLELQSFGLAYLMEHFCGLAPDKRYQMADWRLRPLPAEMLKYAREDTHYLLYVGDLLKQRLVSSVCKDQQEPLLEVYKRSRDVCLKLYEKEITTESSYLQVYGLEERKFQPQQLAVLSGLYMWRDQVARVEDESTGYVLPNHLLLKLAEEMPDDVKKLRTMLNGRHTLVARNIATIVEIINKVKSVSPRFEIDEEPRLQAVKSKPAALFEEIAFSESTPVSTEVPEDETVFLQDDKASNMNVEKVISTPEGQGVQNTTSVQVSERTLGNCVPDVSCNAKESLTNAASVVLTRATRSSLFGNKKARGKVRDKSENQKETNHGVLHGDVAAEKDVKVVSSTTVVELSEVTTSEKQEASSQKSQVDDLAFMIGDMTSCQTEFKGVAQSEDLEQAEARSRAERIRASFALPFHTFDGGESSSKPALEHERVRAEQFFDENTAAELEQQQTEDIILMETHISDSFRDQETQQASYSVVKGICVSTDGVQHRLWWPDSLGSDNSMVNEPADTSDAKSLEPELPLSLSQKFRPFQNRREGMQSDRQFTQSRMNNANGLENEGPNLGQGSYAPSFSQLANQNHSDGMPLFTPFDYAAAKQNMGFLRGAGEARVGTEEPPSTAGSMRFHQGSSKNHMGSNQRIFDPHRRVKDFKPEGISPGKRRQVFPQSGNRTGVFK